MALEREKLKVVRCSYFELKKLAEKYEKPKKVIKDSKSMYEFEKCNTLSEITTENKSQVVKTQKSSRQQNNISFTKTKGKVSVVSDGNADVNADGNAEGRLFSAGEKITRKNGLIETNKTRLDVSREREPFVNNEPCESSKISRAMKEDNYAYDRGSISPHRLLYDPSNDKGESVLNRLNMKMLRLKTDDAGNEPYDDIHSVKQYQRSSKKLNKQVVEGHLFELRSLITDLDNLLSRQTLASNKDTIQQIFKLSSKVQEKCKEIMLTDLNVFITKEVYLNLWRSGIYQVIEKLRFFQRSSQEVQDCAPDVWHILKQFLQETNTFIQSLVTSLEELHSFSLRHFLDLPYHFENSSRGVKMSLLCCHHFMIFLGDTERYLQNLSSTKDWSVARSLYIKASKIAPRNAKPFNQLAVIAVYAKRRLDAVYNYMRCLTASNPILTAREKLHAIFDDVQRKVNELLAIDAAKKTKQTSTKKNAFNSLNSTRKGSLVSQSSEREAREESRHEMWVFYQNGIRREFLLTHRGLQRKEQNNSHCEINKERPIISLNEIKKEFEIIFLHCHAMLYSKIGIDRFSQHHGKMVSLLRMLLRHPSNEAVQMKRLVEIMVINIFGIENVVQESSGVWFEGTPVDLALNLASDVMECLCKATIDVITSSERDNSHVLVLTNYVPAIKVWFDWMKLNIDLLRSSSISVKKEHWTSIAVLLNSLRPLYYSNDEESFTPGDVIVTLPEDDLLVGFKILAHASKPRVNVEANCDQEKVRRELRHNALQSMVNFFCDFEDLPLRFEQASQLYYVTDTMISVSNEDNQTNGNGFDEVVVVDDDDVIIESVEDVDSDSELTSPVRELRARKDALKNQILHQQQRKDEAQAVLNKHSSMPTLMLEINVQYLVPDTNCFIDHLSDLKSIVDSRFCTIVIPLIVINELDGLAKGFATKDFNEQQRVQHVAIRARRAVDFLEYHFSLTDSQMLALTSKGSVLTTIAFRSEESSADRSINDDIILKCCTYYCDAKTDIVNKLASAEQPFTIRRKVALLTDDRNLRLKAHVHNIPVVSIQQFMEMIRP